MNDKPDPTRKSSPLALSEARTLVRSKYLGQAGIHAVGARSKENVVRLYVSPPETDEQRRLFADIRRDIEPASLEVVFDDAPAILHRTPKSN